MQDINWIQIGVGFFSGGAFGAFIKQYFDSRKSKIQAIGFSIEIKPFYNSGDNHLLNSQVIFKDDSDVYAFNNLFTGTINLINTGQNDYSQFNFGLTTSKKIKFLHVKPITLDRHHMAEFINEPSLKNQINSFDVSLKPFNRKDNYIIDILLATEQVGMSESDIKISSSMPIKWSKINSFNEIGFEMVNNSLLQTVGKSILDTFVRLSSFR